MPKPCAKRSKTEEAVERYSLCDFEGCIPQKAKKMLEEQSIQYLCSISGNLFWSNILCCHGRFVGYKCIHTTDTLVWAHYLLLSAIKYSPQWPFCPLGRTFSAHLLIHCSIHKADHYFLSIPHNLNSSYHHWCSISFMAINTFCHILSGIKNLKMDVLLLHPNIETNVYFLNINHCTILISSLSYPTPCHHCIQ